MKIETGVMVMKDGKAWGVIYADGQSTEYGWIAPENGEISDPKFVKTTSDLTRNGGPWAAELSTGKLVHVVRTTTVVMTP